MKYLLPLLLLSGCFVEGGQVTQLTFTLALPQKSTLDPGTLFVQACLEAQDLSEPICEEVTLSEEAPTGTITLTVPSGEGRTLFLVGFWSTGGDTPHVETFTSFLENLTLAPGPEELDVELEETPLFRVEGQLLGEHLPNRVTPVDVLTGIHFPTVEVSSTGAFLLQGLPTGRFFYLLPNNSKTPYRFCPIYAAQPGYLQKTINIDDESC